MDAQERFTVLWQAHHGAVLRYARRRIDAESAADVVSDTFLVAWRRLDDIPADHDQVRPWLYGVARRVLANAERSRNRTDRLSAQLSRVRAGGDPVPDPSEGVTERASVRQALGQLSEMDQEVLRLIGWEDLDLGQAAIVMGCSRATMTVRLHRARRRLERALRAIEAAECGRVTEAVPA